MAIFGFMTRKDENYFRKEAVSALQSYVNSNTRKLKSALFYDETEKDLAGKRDKLARSCIAQINGNPQPNKDQVVAILKKAAEDNLKLTQEANEHLKRVYANDMEIPYNNARGEHVSSMEASKPKKQVGEGELQGILKTQLSHFQKIIQTITQSAQRRANPTPAATPVTPVTQPIIPEYDRAAAIEALRTFITSNNEQLRTALYVDEYMDNISRTRNRIAEECIAKISVEPKLNNDQVRTLLESASKNNVDLTHKANQKLQERNQPQIGRGQEALQKILNTELVKVQGILKATAKGPEKQASPENPAPKPATPRRP